MVYINEVRDVMKRFNSNDYHIKKLTKKENNDFKGYMITFYKPNMMHKKNALRELTQLGLILVSKRTDKYPYNEKYQFNY